MFSLTIGEFDAWLRGYKVAWETRDPGAAAALFTLDAEYYWTPFDTPKKGRAEIAAAWEGAVRGQRDVTFGFTVIAAVADRGIAHWHTRLTSVPEGAPVELDGIVIAEFARPGQCRVFREWWHARGGPS